MLFTVLVSLYTSRVILDTLGIVDYGIYNVVGGVVAMFGFITNTMSSASQRFFAFEIGRNNPIQLQRTFSVTLSIYLFFSISVVLLGETVGLWFVYNKLTIPPERLNATLWVYQFSLLAFIVTILRIPYNALIIAREKMGFYAWSSIIEVSLRLLIVFLLVYSTYDKLKFYSVLTFGIITIITIVYYIFCRYHFKECKYQFSWDKSLFKSLFGFASWNLFGSIANVGMNQGINILLNIFFNPAINAARGIAFQISAQVTSFVGNFQMAAAPQIIKYYAANEIPQMKKLYYQSSRLSYFLLLTISLPIFIEMDFILNLWLKDVPEYTIIFARLVLINRLIDCLSGTTIPVVQATGKIKTYQIFVGCTLILNVPISYLFLHLGYKPESTMAVMITISFISLFIRLIIIKNLLNFKIIDYLNQVVKKNIFITFCACLLPLFLYYKLKQDAYSFLIIGCSSVLLSIGFIYIIGLTKQEKEYSQIFIKNKLQILKRHKILYPR